MPFDLNNFDLDSFAAEVAKLPPGQSLMTEDGLVIRRRQSVIGYDCGVGLGGFGAHRSYTPIEAAEYVLEKSAARSHSASLGGEVPYDNYETAIEEVRKGKVVPRATNPAAKALRRLSTRADLTSYRVRAKHARDALARGDVNGAIHQLETIIEHAGNTGRLKDIERAEVALEAIRNNHDPSEGLPELKDNKIEVRVKAGKHHVYKNGVEVAGGLTEAEANSRKTFLTREAARSEGVAAIDKEIKDNAVPEEAVA